MLHAFSWELQSRLNEQSLDEGLKSSIIEQRVKLAGVEIPQNADPAERQLVHQVVQGSFVTGFRLILMICAALAVASALSAWLLIGRSRPIHTRKQ
jgi:hypothetical protein